MEGGKIFIESEDREDFLTRVAVLVEKKGLAVYAWALMPNHFRLLVRTIKTPLSHCMRKLTSGYAGYFNRKHRLFRARIPKSVLCEEESYYTSSVASPNPSVWAQTG